ncbi:MAG: response regulator [Bdellovibrionota bacterium]
MSDKVDILLVDDRPEGLVTLEATLNQEDYNLIKANSGREALAKVLTHDFAVILMDVQMPEMDGFETATVIKQRDRSKNIPIIFITAINKTDQYVSAGYAVGAVDYIFKPFDPHILKSKVAVFADLFRKTRLLTIQSETLREIEKRERIRTLKDLESEGRRRYQNLADAIPQIICRTNKKGEIEYYNQFWNLYTGLSLEESTGDGWKKVIHQDELAAVERKWTQAFIDQIGFDLEVQLRRQDGVYRWHNLRVVPEFTHLSELYCWIGTASDIHDQKIVQQELLRAKKLADAGSEAKSRFLANMSHEIRTPLGAILGFSELLINPKISSEERNEFISTIRRNGDQLSRIIDEILDLSKVEAGRLEVERCDVSIIDVLNDVRTLMSFSTKEKGLDLEFNIIGKIPERIQTDAGRLQQVLINIIGNAIKFSAKGKIEINISVQENHFIVAVKDTGPGLAATQIENLFQPFTQGDPSITRKHGGTGLGLALSRKLARALGGDIRVKPSLPGEGSVFIISVATGPLEGVELTDSLTVKPKHLNDFKKQHHNILKGIKVLLVEDSADNQILVTRFLDIAGANVDLANNGLEGVKKAMEGNHDIVLMDIQMPELDGYGAISRLRQSGFKKPIIALSAYGMIEERRYSLQIGSNDHLTKPINRTALIERVADLASQSH